MREVAAINWPRALLVGLAVGAAIAFVSELLRPRRVSGAGYRPENID